MPVLSRHDKIRGMTLPFRFIPPDQAALGLCLWALATSTAALAEEPKQTLQDRRMAIYKGTAPGVVLIEAPTAHSDPGAPGPAGSASAPLHHGLFSNLPAPSGRTLHTPQSLNGPDQGLHIRTALDKATSVPAPASANPAATAASATSKP